MRYYFVAYRPVPNHGWVKFYEEDFDDLEKAKQLGKAFVDFGIGDRDTGGNAL